MKLARFTGVGIRGYLNFDIRFDRQLTFVTGINGSGKTTALNAIVALISPDLRTLASIEFRELFVGLEYNGDNVQIFAKSDATSVTLSTSTTQDSFVFKKYVSDSELPPSRQTDAESEHYRDLFAVNASHPVLQIISALPTPMFLVARFCESDKDFCDSVSVVIRTTEINNDPQVAFGEALRGEARA